MQRNNNLRICFISDNYNKCMEKLFKNFDLTQFENKIHTFLTKESYEYIFNAISYSCFCSLVIIYMFLYK